MRGIHSLKPVFHPAALSPELPCLCAHGHWAGTRTDSSRPPCVTGIDLLAGYDVGNDGINASIERFIRGGRCIGVWFGLPCSSWGRARRGTPYTERTPGVRGGFPAAVRDGKHPWGLPAALLSPVDQRVLQTQNHLARVTLRLLHACRESGVTWAVENPAGSRFWSVPEFVEMVCDMSPCFPRCFSIITDYCQWGTPWRKATRVTFCGWPVRVTELAKRCHPHRCGQGQPCLPQEGSRLPVLQSPVYLSLSIITFTSVQPQLLVFIDSTRPLACLPEHQVTLFPVPRGAHHDHRHRPGDEEVAVERG